MITPIIILAILSTPWTFARLIFQPTERRVQAGLLGLALVFGFFSLGHFIRGDEMVQMLPAWVPERPLIILLTGILEVIIAVGLLIPRIQGLAAFTAIAVLVGFFPANIYAALNYTGMGGHAWGPEYLLIRTPLQAILIGWAYWFGLRMPAASQPPTELPSSDT